MTTSARYCERFRDVCLSRFHADRNLFGNAVARCLWPDIVAFFESEEGQKEFEAWKRQQDKENMEQENQLKAA